MRRSRVGEQISPHERGCRRWLKRRANKLRRQRTREAIHYELWDRAPSKNRYLGHTT